MPRTGKQPVRSFTVTANKPANCLSIFDMKCKKIKTK